MPLARDLVAILTNLQESKQQHDLRLYSQKLTEEVAGLNRSFGMHLQTATTIRLPESSTSSATTTPMPYTNRTREMEG